MFSWKCPVNELFSIWLFVFHTLVAFRLGGVVLLKPKLHHHNVCQLLEQVDPYFYRIDAHEGSTLCVYGNHCLDILHVKPCLNYPRMGRVVSRFLTPHLADGRGCLRRGCTIFSLFEVGTIFCLIWVNAHVPTLMPFMYQCFCRFYIFPYCHLFLYLKSSSSG